MGPPWRIDPTIHRAISELSYHGDTSRSNHFVTYHFSDLHEVYSGNRQIHTKCQLQYLHPPHISTSGKCHCVIIHQTTKDEIIIIVIVVVIFITSLLYTLSFRSGTQQKIRSSSSKVTRKTSIEAASGSGCSSRTRRKYRLMTQTRSWCHRL